MPAEQNSLEFEQFPSTSPSRGQLTSAQSSLKINNVGEKSHVDKQGTEFFQTTNSNELFPSKAIARKMMLSKCAHFSFCIWGPHH